VKHVLYRRWYTLFSTLHHFCDRPFSGKVVCCPRGVMALTIALPVVVTPLVTEKFVELPAVTPRSPDSRLIDFEEEGVEVERALIAEEEAVEELHELKYNKWLM